jgi:hypothetical protein
VIISDNDVVELDNWGGLKLLQISYNFDFSCCNWAMSDKIFSTFGLALWIASQLKLQENIVSFFFTTFLKFSCKETCQSPPSDINWLLDK